MVNTGDSLKHALIHAGFPKAKVTGYKTPKEFTEYAELAELVPFCDKACTRGILVFASGNVKKAAQFTIKKIKTTRGGAQKPVICDFCYTLRPGSSIGLITFTLNQQKTKTVAFYCCADLLCSLHVRGITGALDYAKVQIREDVTINDRIDRLITKTGAIFATNGSRIVG